MKFCRTESNLAWQIYSMGHLAVFKARSDLRYDYIPTLECGESFRHFTIWAIYGSLDGNG